MVQRTYWRSQLDRSLLVNSVLGRVLSLAAIVAFRTAAYF